MTLSSHRNRLITAVVLLAVVALALYLGGIFLLVLVALIGGLALLEFYAMFWPTGSHFIEKIAGLILAWGLFGMAQHEYLHWIAGFFILAFAFVAIRFLLVYAHGEEASFADWILMPAGVCYIGLFLSPALVLTPVEQVLVILAPAFTDMGGYYIGSRFGKKKICPRVSPHKSWAGAVGGMAACMVLCMILGGIWGQRNILFFLGLGAAVSVAAQFGDFFESALKRTQGVKDSGSLLPGHGGILDRIDSLLFAVPMYVFLDLFFDFF